VPLFFVCMLQLFKVKPGVVEHNHSGE